MTREKRNSVLRTRAVRRSILVVTYGFNRQRTTIYDIWPETERDDVNIVLRTACLSGDDYFQKSIDRITAFRSREILFETYTV